MANISRRNFMKVAAGAAGIAGLGLLNGCSKTEAPASSAAASAAGSAAEGTTTPAAAAVRGSMAAGSARCGRPCSTAARSLSSFSARSR